MKWGHKKVSGLKTLLASVLVCGALAAWQPDFLPMAKEVLVNRLFHYHTVEDRVGKYGGIVRERLAPYFEKAGVMWPAQRITLVGLKDERLLEVWVEDRQRNMKLVRTYPILGASGTSGPKLKEGDGQVPEGIYSIESLNPNSAFHLSLRINYPNTFDRERAKEEGRECLGGDIMIHGNVVSAGCLAMGDETAEDLFVMVALAGSSNVEVVLSPCDLRAKRFQPPDNAPAWISLLYQTLEIKLKNLNTPVSRGQGHREEHELLLRQPTNKNSNPGRKHQNSG